MQYHCACLSSPPVLQPPYVPSSASSFHPIPTRNVTPMQSLRFCGRQYKYCPNCLLGSPKRQCPYSRYQANSQLPIATLAANPFLCSGFPKFRNISTAQNHLEADLIRNSSSMHSRQVVSGAVLSDGGPPSGLCPRPWLRRR